MERSQYSQIWIITSAFTLRPKKMRHPRQSNSSINNRISKMLQALLPIPVAILIPITMLPVQLQISLVEVVT